MKRILALLLIAVLCLPLAACGATESTAPGQTQAASADVHKIGVIVYNLGDEEVLSFKEYLQGYIETQFEDVHFVYSGSILSGEEEMDFIRRSCEDGVEGFLSFLSYDLAAEVALCKQYGAYYVLASGTVTDEAFESVAEEPSFLGMFGPGEMMEYESGAAMARWFAKKYGDRYLVFTGGSALGNEMHRQRTMGIIDKLSGSYGVRFTIDSNTLAAATEPTELSAGDLSITLCPGYLSRDEYMARARQTLSDGEYDAALFVLPPLDLAAELSEVSFGVIDSYNTRNFQLFTSGNLRYVAGKYAAMAGPAFALMYNAVTGYADQFRDHGRALKVVMPFWTSSDREDFNEKYGLATSATKNAYNIDDLQKVICVYNKDARVYDLVALAEACSYEAVLSRRGG